MSSDSFYRWGIIALFLGICYQPPLSAQQDAKRSTAVEILMRVNDAYAKCQSYRDCGLITTTFFHKNIKHTTEKELFFSTFFVRPDRFRFECYRDKPKVGNGIVWANGKNVRVCGDANSDARTAGQALVPSGPPFTFYLETSAGVSKGASITIPSLLLPKEFKGQHVTYLWESEIVDDEGYDFYCISGLDFQRDRVSLWIDKGTLLIHKIEEEHQSPKLDWKTVTLLRPQFDCEINERALAFEQNEENDVKAYVGSRTKKFFPLLATAVLLIVCFSVMVLYLVRRMRRPRTVL